jgi:hypothetical protein
MAPPPTPAHRYASPQNPELEQAPAHLRLLHGVDTQIGFEVQVGIQQH